MVTILLPGRNHMLTKFQHQYLRNLINDGINGKKVERIIFAVTSSNHDNTRRNPVPLYLRTMAIMKFVSDLPCEIKIYPIPDIAQSKKFAKYALSQIFYQSGEKLIPTNTILACSTSNVAGLFKKEGFSNLPMELINIKKEKYSTLRPYEIIDLLISSGKNWKHDKKWKEHASEATQNIYLEYNLGELIIELFNDSLINEDADITETRDYNMYAAGMNKNVQFKFEDIKPFVKEGKIVDVGCGTGALISLLAKEFQESDIIGIEATRKFYEFCKMQEYANPFVFFYRRNILDQNFKENTINTFVYSSILHEIYSYISKEKLIKVLKNTYEQLVNNGRIVIRDVVGPDNPQKIVYMSLNKKNGKPEGGIKELSTYAKFFRFARDFKPRKIKFKKVKIDREELIKISLVDAYEYISKMEYTDNWDSEMHEEFGFWSIKKWKKELEKIGFKIVEGSREFRSQYIIDKMYNGKVVLYSLKGKQLIEEAYPPTNMILAGEK
ncbi:MAG: methyltransferase domain-containing protein [Nanoarchaeota archaeon]|nr:methyltransferase domain-containing protein [Nanoarchaeota archaeon]